MNTKLKNFLGVLLALFLLSLTWASYKGALFLESAQGTAEAAKTLINEAKPKINSTLDHADKASQSLEASSKAVEKVSNAQANLFLDKKTATNFGVLLRKTDNIVRIIDHLESIAEQVDNQTISKTNNAIEAGNKILDQGTKSLQNLDTVLLTTNTKIENLGNIAEQDLKQIHVLLSDENITTILSNSAQTSESIKQIVQDLEISTEEIKQNLPELITELKSILHNIDQGTFETSTFLHKINTPLTKKEKALRALIQILFIGAQQIRR